MSLETKGLSIGYDSDLVKDISFQVKPGFIVTLIGPNGSGKSTLLRTVTGQLMPRGGVIVMDGADLGKMSAKDIARKLSMVMTNRISPELMTCREVIESGRYAYTGMFGRLSDNDQKKVEEAISATDTEAVADRPFTNISDGQRQRVMLARAIAQEPEILVLDEPTSFLDIRYKMDILTRIKELAKSRNIGILMSVHEPEVAMMLSDTVIAMGDGKIKRIGTCSEVFEEGFIRELYGLEDADVTMLPVKPWIRRSSISESGPARIMVAGTMSNVGKSVIAAGLCRVLTRRGYRVSPFKSQNMANNSYVTEDGLEMGRAQVVQAQCCKVTPQVYMNPVLLKPVTDQGSQVIVNGIPVGNMKASRYFEYKKQLVPVIMEAFNRAKDDSDVVVIEGAGSVAEINLRENDIVNMGLAQMTSSPVILVGDIDRGGVFAQLLGTIDLLDDSEKSRIKGLVINKFRGDPALLKSGLDMLEERCGIPVLGVVPFTELDIDDEDSLSVRLYEGPSREGAKSLDIAVIKLPHIANFTDLDVLQQARDVSIRYVSDPEKLAGCDMIVIPGTKNTISDMKQLEDSGMADAIKSYAKGPGVVLGICGGYQMLGKSISDPEGYEGGGEIPGLGLLPVRTVITDDKRRKQFTGVFSAPTGVLSCLKGQKITGYEIHMGRTQSLSDLCEFTSDGTGYCRDNIYGTYVHGLFDEKDIAEGVIRAVAKACGRSVDTSGLKSRRDRLEEQYEHLADVLEESLDIEAVCRIMQINGYADENG